MAQKILLVEDDPCFGSVLKSYLELSDYEVTLCVNGNDGLEAFRKDKFDICLLDVMMPEMDGFTLGKKIREIDGNVPFVYITAKSMKEDMKQGYEIGADDYIVKPFRIRELLARVRRILSANIKNGEKDNIIYMGHAAIHTDEAKVYVNDKSIELTALEYRLLLIFASNKGSLLARQQILDKIWDADGNFVEDNTLTVYVKRLREKLGEAIHIETVRGMGYRVD